MKSYEILPAGMTGSVMGRGAKVPKSYEILPVAGTAAQGLVGWTGGASAIARGVSAYGASSDQGIGLPYDPAGVVPTSGGATVPGMERQPKSYEILPEAGATVRGHGGKSGGCGSKPGGCGCGGKCGGGSGIWPPRMLPRDETRRFGGAGLRGSLGGLVDPPIRATEVHPVLTDWKPLALTCDQLWSRYRILAHEYVQWQWSRSMIADARNYLQWMREHTAVSPHQRAYCDIFSNAAAMIAREMLLFSSGRTSQERDINFRLDRLFWSLSDLTSLCQQTIDQEGRDDGFTHSRADDEFEEALSLLDAHNQSIEPAIHNVIAQMMAMGCNLPERYFWGRPANL